MISHLSGKTLSVFPQSIRSRGWRGVAAVALIFPLPSLPACFTRSRCRLALAALLLGMVPAPAMPAQSVEELFRAGRAKAEAGDHAGAVQLFDQVIKLVPNADGALMNRASAKRSLKDFAGAIADYHEVIRLNPQHPDAYLARATTKIENGDFKGSIGDLNTAINQTPERALLYALRGSARRDMGALPLAIADFSRALELDPKLVDAWSLRAWCHKDAGDLQQAIMDFGQVIRLEPDQVEARMERGMLRFHQQNFSAALVDLVRAVELAPQDVWPVNWLSYTHFAAGENQLAVVAMERAVELDAKAAKYPMLLRHFALRRLGKPDQRLATTWGHWSDDPWAQALAQAIVGRITPEALLKLADEPADEKDRNGRRCEAHYYLGLAQQQAGEKDKAAGSFKASVATGVSTYIEYTLAARELSQP